MKLFLCSHFSSVGSLIKEEIENKKVAFIPTASLREGMQQYGIAVKESRGQLSYLPAGRTKFIRAKHLGDKFDKAAVLATLQANAERKPKRSEEHTSELQSH